MAVQSLLLQVGVMSLSLDITLGLTTITIWSEPGARYEKVFKARRPGPIDQSRKT